MNTCLVCEAPTRNVKFCTKVCETDRRRAEYVAKIQRGEITDPKSLKLYLLRTRRNACVICDTEEWQGKPVPLVMDHANGNAEDNRPDNLRLVCRNCDGQLPTFAGRNRGNGRAWRRDKRRAGFDA